MIFLLSPADELKNTAARPARTDFDGFPVILSQ